MLYERGALVGRAIAILGMHRSGTSTVSGLMGLLGAYLGPGEHLMGGSPGNLKGHFEFGPFVEMNEALLARAGMAWNSVPPLMPEWVGDPAFEEFRIEAAARVRMYFAGAQVWAFKDPRSCITFPIWRSVIPAPLEAVLVFRNPIEVADSLAARDQLSREHALALWVAHVVASIRYSHGLRRHVMFYEDLVTDLDTEAERLREFSMLPKLDAAGRKAVKDYVEQDFRHHRRTLAELAGRPDVLDSVVQLFQALRNHVDLAKKGDAEDFALDRIVATP